MVNVYKAKSHEEILLAKARREKRRQQSASRPVRATGDKRKDDRVDDKAAIADYLKRNPPRRY